MHGALRPIVNPPATDGCKKPPRHAQVMELLKHGFKISGRDQGHWPTELEWLFRLRNLSVHHSEELQPLVEEIRTDRVVVFAPAEAETFSPENARRAANFAKEVIEHCMQHPEARDRRVGRHAALVAGKPGRLAGIPSEHGSGHQAHRFRDRATP